MGQGGDLLTSRAWDVISGWGLKGTHITGNYRSIGVPFSPWDAKIDLTTMRVTESDGKKDASGEVCIP